MTQPPSNQPPVANPNPNPNPKTAGSDPCAGRSSPGLPSQIEPAAPPRFECVWDGNVLVWICHGPLTSLTEVEPLRCFEPHWSRLEAPEAAGVVLDLADSAYLGSLMLEAARTVWVRLSAHKKNMAVCHVTEVVREILRLSRFDILWPICETRADAVAHVRRVL